MTSPIIHLPFNDTNLGVDTSGSGLTFTNTDVSLVTDIERGSVASFNGTTSLLNLPSASVPSGMLGTGVRTFIAWIKIVHLGYSFAVFYSYGVNSSFGRWQPSYNSSKDYYVNVDSANTSQHDLEYDTWYHIANSFDGTNVNHYLNGVELVSPLAVNTQSGDFNIGGNPTLSSNYFSGFMSDFRVYDTLLTASDILTDYNQTNSATISILPRDPPYSSTVLANSSQLAPLVSGTIVHKEKHQVIPSSTDDVLYSSSYVHDENTGESVEVAREEVTMDESGSSAQFTFGVLQEDASGVQTIRNVISTNPSSTTISSTDSGLNSMCNLKIDGGISWDTDDACLYLSSNKRFRFKYIESDGFNPARLSIQGFDNTTSTYVTKADFFTD